MANINEPRGFYAVAKHCGIKPAALDLACVYSDVPAAAAAMFTQSRFAGPAIKWNRSIITNQTLQAIFINSGNANVATGEAGEHDVHLIASQVGNELGVSPQHTLVSSTGVIGRRLPMDKIQRCLSGIKGELSQGRLPHVAEAIMTTDTRPKFRSVRIGKATLFGMAKGAGMIEPNMATMLAYFFTDAEINSVALKLALVEAVNASFNRISVDTDTSTSDTTAIMANGRAGFVHPQLFGQELKNVAIELAKDILRYAEGATKLIEVHVQGARTLDQAKRIAKTVVNSPLVKTAVYGCDPNWGRVAAALGKTYDSDIEPSQVVIGFGSRVVYDKGTIASDVELANLRNYLRNKEVRIEIDIGVGSESATVWGCDLTEKYVQINADYTT